MIINTINKVISLFALISVLLFVVGHQCDENGSTTSITNDQQSPTNNAIESVLDKIVIERSQLCDNYDRDLADYKHYYAYGTEMTQAQPGEASFAFRQSASYVFKIQQIQYAVRYYGLNIASKALDDLLTGLIRPDLKFDANDSELLLVRTKLRALIDALQYTLDDWKVLHLMFKEYNKKGNHLLNVLATDAYRERHQLSELVVKLYEQQQQLLEGKQQPEVLIAHLDNVIDYTTGCHECSKKRPDNLLEPYPMIAYKSMPEKLVPIYSDEADSRILRDHIEDNAPEVKKFSSAQLAQIDEADISEYGERFLSSTN